MSGLHVVDLEIGYRRGQPVARCSFEVMPGQVAAVIGPNGAGKSTLLKTLLGLMPALGGAATIGGVAVHHHRQQSGIGYLPEQVNFPSCWTMESALMLAAGACAHGTPIDHERALRIAGVELDWSMPVARMSKGMRQRLAIALAFTPVPHLALLDEPESGLDPAQRVRFRAALREFVAGGRIAVVASHDLSGIGSIADIVVLCKSGIGAAIPAGRIRDTDSLAGLFGRDSAC